MAAAACQLSTRGGGPDREYAPYILPASWPEPKTRPLVPPAGPGGRAKSEPRISATSALCRAKVQRCGARIERRGVDPRDAAAQPGRAQLQDWSVIRQHGPVTTRGVPSSVSPLAEVFGSLSSQNQASQKSCRNPVRRRTRARLAPWGLRVLASLPCSR
jgi:hypothetical protein